MDPLIAAFAQEGEKVLHFLAGEYAKLQSGRANAAMVEHVDVFAYGQTQPLKTLAGISLDGARTIVIQPWDASIAKDIEVGLQKADIGATPTSDGRVIRLTLPTMTEERRKVLAKDVHKIAEEARISVRQQRQIIHDAIKQEKDEDVKERLQKDLQTAVDKVNTAIDEHMKKKEQEIMTV